MKKVPFLIGLARISHQPPAAADDAPCPAMFSHIGMLDGQSSTTPRPSGRKPHWTRHLAAHATKVGEICGLALCAVLSVGAADIDRLIFHAESLKGEILWSNLPDRAFNPASVIKVGTSLWALDILGPHQRYTTRIGHTGSWEKDTIEGDLVIDGAGDPDFHAENVILIAHALNQLGIRKVTGGIIVTGNFWMGWEHGEANRVVDAARRGPHMGRLFRSALDHSRWSSSIEASWTAMCDRRGWSKDAPPSVRVSGSAVYRESIKFEALVTHRSNTLPSILRRFNIYSNNDIVRIADTLGGVKELEKYLRKRLSANSQQIDLGTASGEFRNRMTGRLVVSMLRELYQQAALIGLSPENIFPVLGCDPGPTRRMFPMLTKGELAASVTCKTGTLSTTDGGVAVLSGFFTNTEHDEVLFIVAAEKAGGQLRRWRGIEQEWLLDLIKASGGAIPGTCKPDHDFSDSDTKVELVGSKTIPALGLDQRPSVDYSLNKIGGHHHAP